MKIKSFVFIALSCVLCFSCNNSPKVKTYADAEREFKASLTREDTLAVLDLVREFFTNIEKEQTDAALDMINVVDNSVLYRIDLESREFLRPRFTRMPASGWGIDTYSFSTAGNNEFKCNYGGMKLVFNPVKVGSKWYLTLMDGFPQVIGPYTPAPDPIRLNTKDLNN